MIEKILKKYKITYKIENKNNISIIEFQDEKMLVVIRNKTNVFKINREVFYYIDDKLLPYAFCLLDEYKHKIYLIKIKEPQNSIRKAFERTTKDEIFFGKEVLQNEISEKTLINEINLLGSY